MFIAFPNGQKSVFGAVPGACGIVSGVLHIAVPVLAVVVVPDVDVALTVVVGLVVPVVPVVIAVPVEAFVDVVVPAPPAPVPPTPLLLLQPTSTPTSARTTREDPINVAERMRNLRRLP